MPELYYALDTKNISEVKRLSCLLAPVVDGFKIGLEYFCAHGPKGIEQVLDTNKPYILDLKLHDIPNTVAGAIRSVVPLAPSYITLHASGGVEMMQVAQDAAIEESCRLNISAPHLLAITVLTSLDDSALEQQGIFNIQNQVITLSELARKASISGVVSSYREAAILRLQYGPNFIIMTPGIKFSNTHNDQKRTVTPSEIQNDANIIVIGRAITNSLDPLATAQSIKQRVTDK